MNRGEKKRDKEKRRRKKVIDLTYVT